MASAWVDPDPDGFITTPIDLGSLFAGRPLPINNGLLSPVPPNDPSRLPGRRTWLPVYAIAIEVLTTVLVLIRIASRLNKLGGRPGLDDTLICLAWLLGVGVTACIVYGSTHLGWDRHTLHTNPFLFSTSALLTTIVQLLFTWSTMFTKLSVLMFYRRLVRGTYSLKYKWALWFGMFSAIITTIVPTILLLISCTPIEAVWMQYSITYILENAYKFHCEPQTQTIRIGQATGSLSVVVDFYCVMLPAILLMQMKINKRQKLGLMAIFGVGFLVVAAGAARTYFLSEAEKPIPDRGWTLYNVFAAAIAECNVGIICACAPCLKSVCGKFFRDISSRQASKENSKNSSTGCDSHTPLKSDLLATYDTSYSELDTKPSSLGGANFTHKLSSQSHQPKQKFEKGLSPCAETNGHGGDAFNHVVEGHDDIPITRFESCSTSELPPVESSTHPTVRQPEMFQAPFDLGGLLSSPPIHSSTRNTPSVIPAVATIRADSEQRLDTLRPPIEDERSETPSFIFIDNGDGEEKVKRVRYRSYIESSDSSIAEEMSLSFPHMNPVISRTQSLKDAAELARQQALSQQASRSTVVPSQQALRAQNSVSDFERPSTTGQISSGPSAFGFGRVTIGNAPSYVVRQPQQKVTTAASPFGSSEKPENRHRNSISHISDPSETGSYNGDFESEIDPRGFSPSTGSKSQFATMHHAQPATSANNVRKFSFPISRPSTSPGELSAASVTSRRDNVAAPSMPVTQHPQPLSSPFSSNPVASTTVPSRVISSHARADNNTHNSTTSTSLGHEGGPLDIGMALPWAPNPSTTGRAF